MKNILIYLLVIVLFLLSKCDIGRQRIPKITDTEVEEALVYFIDSFIVKVHQCHYSISPQFYGELNDAIMNYISFDSIINDQNIEFMKAQYQDRMKHNIEFYLNNKKDYHISIEKPSDQSIYFVLEPPLFTIDKKSFLIYVRAFFWVEDKIRWDDLFFVFAKHKNNWVLDRKINVKRPHTLSEE